MPDEDINYAAEILKSQVNLGFVGVMIFLMLVVNFWGFLPLLLAGEIGAVFLAQNSRVQRIIRAGKNKDKKIESQETEVEIVRRLPLHYQNSYGSVRALCDEIERRSRELDGDGKNALLVSLTERLSAFRYEYAKMLRAHDLLSNRDYPQLRKSLDTEIARAERAIEQEESQQVRQALAQNLNILTKRADRIAKLGELVRLIEARLQVVKNSLGLIQDEVYTFTDVAGISSLVDSLMTNLTVSEEFRVAYEDVLSSEASLSALAAIEENDDNLLSTPVEDPRPARVGRERRRQ